MTLLVLLILVVMWGAVLLPPWLRSRHESRPGAIGSYRSSLAVLSRSGLPGAPAGRSGPRPLTLVGAPVAIPRGMTLAQARKRRQDILTGLLLAAAATLLVGGSIPALRLVLALHVLVDLALAAYVGLLLQARRVVLERDSTVHYLHADDAPADEPRTAAAGDPLLLLRQAGG